MKQELRNLLIELLNNKNVVESWGVFNIRVGIANVSFSVNALNFSGRVEIFHRKKDYCIKIGDVVVSNVKLEKVTSVIDGIIETSDKYIADVADWICKLYCPTANAI